jgi:tRNA(adenine34) deaminase
MTQPRIAFDDQETKKQIADLVRFTARTMGTETPVPFGASVVETRTGKRLLRTVNGVGQGNDPTAHAETRVIRLACKRIKNFNLKGYTLYTTCEPCPMCMSAILWSGLDRVVYGATIGDAARHCNQIYINASELTEKSDMKCVVDGPIERELCYTLFTHPNMLQKFDAWRKNRR